MATVVFDAHAYVKKLKAVGLTEEQAEVQSETIAALINEQLATKKDLAELERRLSAQMAEQEQRLGARITEQDQRLDARITELGTRITELEYKLINKLGAMMAGSIAIVAALVKLL